MLCVIGDVKENKVISIENEQTAYLKATYLC